jgi:hypothetical protein
MYNGTLKLADYWEKIWYNDEGNIYKSEHYFGSGTGPNDWFLNRTWFYYYENGVYYKKVSILAGFPGNNVETELNYDFDVPASHLITLDDYVNLHRLYLSNNGGDTPYKVLSIKDNWFFDESYGTLYWTEVEVTQPETYTITASTDISLGYGTIDPEGITLVESGGTQTYTITPIFESGIKQVLIDDVNNPEAVATGIYTFTNVTANHTIVAVFESVGINEKVHSDWVVFPNPTTGELRIEMCDMRYETSDMRYETSDMRYEISDMRYEIYDVYGKNVSYLKSQILNHQINISHLPAGIYFLIIESGSGTSVSKVVKQ